MFADDIKTLAYRYNDDFHNANSPSVADEVLAPDFVMHLGFPGMPDPLDREGLKGVVAMFHAHFTGLQHTIEDVIAEGDTVVFRWSGDATHTADLMGIPAKGTRVTATGITIFRVRDRRIVEMWEMLDAAGMMQQLGAALAPSSPA